MFYNRKGKKIEKNKIGNLPSVTRRNWEKTITRENKRYNSIFGMTEENIKLVNQTKNIWIN